MKVDDNILYNPLINYINILSFHMNRRLVGGLSLVLSIW